MAAKLKESAEVYLKDSETLSYYVQQDKKDPTRFSIFERYEQESSLEQRECVVFPAEESWHR